MIRLRIVVLSILGICLLLGPGKVWAHSIVIDDSFNMALGDTEYIGHNDESDWKGTLTLTVTNTGLDPWGDFHFRITSPTDGTVIFRDDDGYVPSMFGAADYSYAIVDSGLGLDFLFYSDPVYQGDSATFTVYTDNTSEQLSFFGISIEPTPVPLVGAVWLLASGLMGMIGMRRKK